MAEGGKTLEDLFCEHLAIKPGFINSISSDSDWGFVIKVHALIEAALSSLMLTRFKEPLLIGIINRLGTSGEDFSKVSVLKELKLLEKEHRVFIRCLSRLRNAFAHDINQIDGTIAGYCSQDAKREAELKSSLLPLIADPVVSGKTIPKKQLVDEHLRMAIWACSLSTVDYLVKTIARLRREGTEDPGNS